MSTLIRFAILLLFIAGCDKPSTRADNEAPMTTYTLPKSDPRSFGAFDATTAGEGPKNVLQELNELLAEQTSLRYERSDHPRKLEIKERRGEIHANELGDLEEVAHRAVLSCAEEPMYGQPSYGIILYATATADIDTNELLLFNADSVFRTTGAEFGPLFTTYEGWYFRPNEKIAKGEEFVVACIQDAPEEIQNVKDGFMPNSDRARNPQRAYRTQIHFRNR